jgi:hypothetical protein
MAAAVVASGATAAINEWVSVGSGAATILGAGIALWGLRRRRRKASRRWNIADLPKPPTALPLSRVTKEDYARQLHAWDVYQARLDQFFEDQKGQDD